MGAVRTSLTPTGDQSGLTVFFIGREARARGLEQTLAQIVESSGFELLRTIDLDGSEAVACLVNGALPAAMFITFDVLPSRVDDEMRPLFPDLDNAHIHEARLRCREVAETELLPIQHELMQSTQNSLEAWRIIKDVLPDEEQALLETIKSRRSAMVTQFKVIRDLTRRGTRSKVELIRYGEGLAVKKTYRHNCLRFMEREASFMERFSPQRTEIPPVLERGRNYLIMPFINGRPLRRFLFGRGFPRLMTLKQVRDTADLVRFLFSHGYDPVDLGPHNLLVDDSGQINAIDHEFMHRSDQPIEAERSACLAGVQTGFQGEWPPKVRWAPQRAKSIDPWHRGWFAYTGLTLHSFLYDPPWLQRLKRAVNYPSYLASKVIGGGTIHGAARARLRRSRRKAGDGDG